MPAPLPQETPNRSGCFPRSWPIRPWLGVALKDWRCRLNSETRQALCLPEPQLSLPSDQHHNPCTPTKAWWAQNCVQSTCNISHKMLVMRRWFFSNLPLCCFTKQGCSAYFESTLETLFPLHSCFLWSLQIDLCFFPFFSICWTFRLQINFISLVKCSPKVLIYDHSPYILWPFECLKFWTAHLALSFWQPGPLIFLCMLLCMLLCMNNLGVGGLFASPVSCTGRHSISTGSFSDDDSSSVRKHSHS